MSTSLASSPVTLGSPPHVPRSRLMAVDLLRGIVIVLMLLDHTRDFVHRSAAVFSPTDLTRTSIELFFTRWGTHFCAPVFSLLAGIGAALQLQRGKTKGELSWFLLTRGVWLIVLEFTLIRLGLAFDFNYAAFPGMLEVIWVLGACMVLLAAIIHLPITVVALAGIAIVVLHNLADGIRVQGFAPGGTAAPSAVDALWLILHQQGFVSLFGAPLLVAYPLVPWIGVMMLGYVLGEVYRWEAERRHRFLARLGLGLIGAFLVLRAINIYGDPAPWSVQRDAVFTMLSFLNTTKYPASLLFLLMTLGPALLALAWFDGKPLGRVGRIFVTYGRVPLFFFVIQWFVAHPLAIGLSLLTGKSIAHLFGMPGATPPAPGAGFSLGVTYLVWIAGLVITYPLCRWLGEVKRRRTNWWLSYL